MCGSRVWGSQMGQGEGSGWSKRCVHGHPLPGSLFYAGLPWLTGVSTVGSWSMINIGRRWAGVLWMVSCSVYSHLPLLPKTNTLSLASESLLAVVLSPHLRSPAPGVYMWGPDYALVLPRKEGPAILFLELPELLCLCEQATLVLMRRPWWTLISVANSGGIR